MAGSNSASATAAALAAMQSSIVKGGAPYRSLNQSLGTPVAVIPDIPVSTVFLVLFAACAAANIYHLKTNQSKGYKFFFNGPMFGFSLIRVISCILRIAWALNPQNVRLALAANIFVYAGVFIFYVINIYFTQRILRALHPHIGWSGSMAPLIPVTMFLSVAGLTLVITGVIQQLYTLSPSIHRMDRDLQLAGSTIFTFLAFLPIPLLLVALVIPKRTVKVDDFGTGSFSTKILLVLASSTLLTLNIAFRTACSYLPPRNALEPEAWYFRKSYFYGLGFALDFVVLVLYIAARVHLRFHVPNGAKGPGSYSAGTVVKENAREIVDVEKVGDGSGYESTASIVGGWATSDESDGELVKKGTL